MPGESQDKKSGNDDSNDLDMVLSFFAIIHNSVVHMYSYELNTFSTLCLASYKFDSGGGGAGIVCHYNLYIANLQQ